MKISNQITYLKFIFLFEIYFLKIRLNVKYAVYEFNLHILTFALEI